MKDQIDCKAAEAAMPDLLFDPGAASPAARAHVAGCDHCQGELAGMERTMEALNAWEAPEPSPFWMARMGALLREEQAAPRRGWAGFVDRFRTRLWLSNVSARTAAAGAALSVMLAVGGGTWADLATHPAAPAVQASNTVRDLQSLNENAQVFQQLSALDEPDTGTQGSD